MPSSGEKNSKSVVRHNMASSSSRGINGVTSLGVAPLAVWSSVDNLDVEVWDSDGDSPPPPQLSRNENTRTPVNHPGARTPVNHPGAPRVRANSASGKVVLRNHAGKWNSDKNKVGFLS